MKTRNYPLHLLRVSIQQPRLAISQGSTLVLHGSPSLQVAPLRRNNQAIRNRRRELRTQPGRNHTILRGPRAGRIERASKSTNGSFRATSFLLTLQTRLYAPSSNSAVLDSAAGDDIVNRDDIAQMGTTVISSPTPIAGDQQPLHPSLMVEEGYQSVDSVSSRSPGSGPDPSFSINRYWKRGRLALWCSVHIPLRISVALLAENLLMSPDWRIWIVNRDHLRRFSQWAHDKAFGAAHPTRFICPYCYSLYGIFLEQDVEHVLFHHPVGRALLNGTARVVPESSNSHPQDHT